MRFVADAVPFMLGGSADLAPSTLTRLIDPKFGDFMPPSSGWGNYGGRNFHFGIREHAVGAIANFGLLCLRRLHETGTSSFCLDGNTSVLDLYPRLHWRW